MALNLEFAEVVQKSGSSVFDIAEKVTYNRNLTAEEKEVYEISDAFAREVGRTGKDRDCEIAAFVQKTIDEELYNAPDELLDTLFTRGTMGEFDQVEYEETVKNTLEVHEASKGGTVDRSWLDVSFVHPFTKNYQVETDLSYVDLRKNGFKAISNLTVAMTEALKNKLFFDVFSIVDGAIVGGDQLIAAGGAVPTQAAWDQFSLYLLDRDATNSVAVCLSKYAQSLGRMSGRSQYMSDSMKDEFNRYGLVNFADGVRIASISGAHKTGRGELLLPDKRIFGCAGAIGALDMVGETHVYQNEDNYNEKIILQAKDFTASVAINKIDNICKMVLA